MRLPAMGAVFLLPIMSLQSDIIGHIYATQMRMFAARGNQQEL
jgi:hypothetical protein